MNDVEHDYTVGAWMQSIIPIYLHFFQYLELPYVVCY